MFRLFASGSESDSVSNSSRTASPVYIEEESDEECLKEISPQNLLLDAFTKDCVNTYFEAIERGALLDTHDNQRNNIVHTAAKYNSLATLMCTIDDFPRSLINESNIANESPLEIAVKKGHSEIVEILLKHGANPEKRTDRFGTCLHLAVQYNKTKILLMLWPIQPPSAIFSDWSEVEKKTSKGVL